MLVEAINFDFERMDLSDLIARNAAFTPEKVALRYAGGLTYAALIQQITAAARALKSVLGVGRGERVAILAANHPDYLVLLYACARLGALLVPLNWRLAVPEQLFILADASAKVLLVQDAFAAVIAPLRQAQPGVRIVRLTANAAADSFDEFSRAVTVGVIWRRAQSAHRRDEVRFSSSTPRARPAARRAPCCARRRSSGTR